MYSLLICFFQLTSPSITYCENPHLIGDTLVIANVSDDARSYVGDKDSIELKDLSMMDLSCHSFIINWGSGQSGVTIKKNTNSQYTVKCFVNLPLLGIDSIYVRTDIIHFNVTYLSDELEVIEIDKSFKPSINWNADDIIRTKELWTNLSQNPKYHKDIFHSSYEECENILILNYYLMYSILKGDITSIDYFKEFPNVFPAINGLTLKEEYLSNKKVLKYYRIIK